jgi:predicted amidohydrolase
MNQPSPRNDSAATAALSRRDFLLASAATAGGALLPRAVHAAGAALNPVALSPMAIEPWAPHSTAAPRTERRGEWFALDANGTRTCTGGWQWRFDDVVPGQSYEVSTDVRHHDVAFPRDAFRCTAIWAAPKPGQAQPNARWEYLLPEGSGDRLRFTRRIVAPTDATQLTIRATLRWTATGKSEWQLPRVVAVAPATPKKPVRMSVVTGTNAERRGGRQFKSAADNAEFYARYCEDACRRDQPAVIVLPETALHWGLRGHALDLATPANGPETEPFAALARRYRTRIALGLYERDGDAVYNSLVLFAPNGGIEGRYRKVHLAHGEDLSGVLPGDSFPVFATEHGRIGCNICMDSMAPESARIAALKGADFLLLSIMGDFRADRWDMGPPVFHEDRWRTIMRSQALDNQFSLVVARNRAIGSCIVTPQGEFLAWNNGDQPFITADVPREDTFRSWNGSSFRDSTWMVRRPQLYGAFGDPTSYGGSM